MQETGRSRTGYRGRPGPPDGGGGLGRLGRKVGAGREGSGPSDFNLLLRLPRPPCVHFTRGATLS